MDPWADSSTTWSPQEADKPPSPRPLPNVSSPYAGGSSVDPWAEPSSSASIPVISTQRRHSNASQDHTREARSNSVGDFDPWGGNSAPVAPLSTAFHDDASDEVDANLAEESKPRAHWPGIETDPEESTYPEDQCHDTLATSGERELEPVVDDDDPWGSGAAARRIKAQQEAESTAQRMEILRLQDEAKGKQIDDGSNEIELKPEKEDTADESKVEKDSKAVTEAPAASGWRSLFNRSTAKPVTGDESKSTKETPKIDTDVVAKESSASSTATIPPRLWQAPAILGSHARSSSSLSRTESIKEAATSTTPPAKGPGWEVTTKKQQQQGGGLIQSLFGSTTINDDEKVTTTATRKETKTTGLNRFGRGLQPPPVVSAADEEDDSFDTEETGIEWEAGNIFDKKEKPLDFLSDEGEARPAESTVGKLLGRWRGREATSSRSDAEDLSKADLSWLDSVGTNGGSAESHKGGAKHADSDNDWMAFMDQQSTSTASSSTVPPINDRMRISSTSKGTISTKVPSLAPPSVPAGTKTASGQRLPSPFSFRGPSPSTTLSLSASRLASAVSARTTSTHDTFDEFEDPSVDEGSNPNDGYRDDVADNDAALLKDRPVQTRSNSSFLRGLQGKGRGSRYDYDVDDVDSYDDSWTAFKDQDHPVRSSSQRKTYQDNDRQHTASPPFVPSANVVRSKSGSNSTAAIKTSGSGILPPAPSSRPLSWNRNAPLLPPPGSRPQSTEQVKHSPQSVPATLIASKPKTLSQGKTLTNDDLSFFENL